MWQKTTLIKSISISIENISNLKFICHLNNLIATQSWTIFWQINGEYHWGIQHYEKISLNKLQLNDEIVKKWGFLKVQNVRRPIISIHDNKSRLRHDDEYICKSYTFET